jgi:hypothetical protein
MDVDADDVVTGMDEQNSLTNDSIASDSADAWSSYRKHRKLRSFGDVREAIAVLGEERGKSDQIGSSTDDVALAMVKDELDIGGDEKDANATLVRTRSSKSKAVTNGHTPTMSETDQLGSAGRQTRKRRGEDQLLLDDHLLPEELRRTGGLSGKRERGHGLKEDTVPVKEIRAEVVQEPGEEEDKIIANGEGSEAEIEETNVDEESDGNDDEEGDGKEVTRCVCQKEGESRHHR